MALKNITNRIVKDAEKDANQIIKEVEQKAELIKKEKNELAKKEAQVLLEKNEKKAKEIHQRIIANAKLEARKIALGQKRDVIKKVFEEAKEKLYSINQENYIEMMMKLIEENASGNEELILSSQDKKTLGIQLIDRTKHSLESKGKRIDITLSDKTRDIGKGFILYKDGIELDFSFDNLIESAKNDLELNIIKELFSGINKK